MFHVIRDERPEAEFENLLQVESVRDFDEVYEPMDMELLHHVGAMRLDSSLARTQIIGDLLIEASCYDLFEDFAFAW